MPLLKSVEQHLAPQNCLFSIIIPVYNTPREWFLECLSSLELLHDVDAKVAYEIIVADDGSTDEATCTVLDELEAQGDFQVLRLTHQGVAATRNRAIAKARGEYIFPVDADDTIEQGIASIIDHLHDNKPDILYGYMAFLRRGKKHYSGRMLSINKYRLWLRGNQLWNAAFYRKELWERLGGYDEAMPTAEDWDFWCRCALLGATFEHFPSHYYCYRQHESENSRDYNTRHLRDQAHKMIQDKIPMSAIEVDELSDTMMQFFRRRRMKKLFVMICYMFLPWLYEKLRQRKTRYFVDNLLD